jgi:hypothetical protein
MPTVARSSRARACATAGSTPFAFTGASVNALEHGLVGEEVELQKHHPDVGSHPPDRPARHR